MSNLPKYVVLYKKIGETPLECIEKWRSSDDNLKDAPLAYAGRLDPLASGQLLVLIGEECKRQETYHALDKTYDLTILFGIESDSGDVLGLVNEHKERKVSPVELESLLKSMIGGITMAYPIFSSRTVKGKPLHTWAMEGRLGEIEIPTKSSTIYNLELLGTKDVSRPEIVRQALEKINSIPPVTDLRKALGNDFRRTEVRLAWDKIASTGNVSDQFMLAELRCCCSSGTYMRSLAKEIARGLKTTGLALNINRTVIGKYNQSTKDWDSIFR